jgi:hypothetical protein
VLDADHETALAVGWTALGLVGFRDFGLWGKCMRVEGVVRFR